MTVTAPAVLDGRQAEPGGLFSAFAGEHADAWHPYHYHRSPNLPSADASDALVTDRVGRLRRAPGVSDMYCMAASIPLPAVVQTLSAMVV